MCYFAWQRDFADVTKFRDLAIRDYPGLSRWVQCNYKEESRSVRAREKEM